MIHDLEIAASSVAPTPAQVCRGAAERIERDGLAKGMYYDERTGRCCTDGALRAAAIGAGRYSLSWPTRAHVHAYDSAWDTVRVLLPDDGQQSLTAWNDRPETTAADAVALLRLAAEQLEATS